MTEASSWLVEAVSEFGRKAKEKLAGPGEREAAIRGPIEGLLTTAGEQLHVRAVFHDEVRDADRRVRPDYGLSVDGAISGYVEVKAPSRGLDPSGFTGHDHLQWERQRDLPNLLYTNGTEWRLYRDGELYRGPVYFSGGTLESAGAGLCVNADFETLISDFLRWTPAPITSVGALVRDIAPLTRLLRGEVLEQLALERKAIRGGADSWTQPFLGLARDWRALLFPTADDETFADGYAQTVTFALLLARTEEISLDRSSLHDVGSQLSDEHSLMGKALQLLTDDVADDFRITLDLLVRVIGAVDWQRIYSGQRDTYLHLYEYFLEEYDNELRKDSGSYYTPREVVEEMVRLTEEVLVTRLDKPKAFRDPDVSTIDPAMGTGTFLHTILERVGEQTHQEDGPGAVAGAVSQAAARIAGFELQMGPYAVAELRATDLLASLGADTPPDGLKMYVTDTLDDPTAAETQIGSGLQLIAQSRRQANKIKSSENVTVVIGNPPYKSPAEGLGGWVEHGSRAHEKNARPILEDFRHPGNGVHERHLKNTHAYFWRWATWKVWESTPDVTEGGTGIVCFITTSAYLTSPGFRGMRDYLRRQSSEGWIIDLTPEGQTPPVPTRIFPKVRQPLAIGIFVRRPDINQEVPAMIHYRSVHGRQARKFEALRQISISDDAWQTVRTGWTEPFTALTEGQWDNYPALSDLMPWVGPGIKASRTWIFAPSVRILNERWATFIAETDPVRRSELLKISPGIDLDTIKDPLPGSDVSQASGPLARESGPLPQPIRVGFRAFDRQWLIPDSRLMQRPGPFWDARIPEQTFAIEQHSVAFQGGPGIIFTSLIPDVNHFNNRAGRALPLFHPSGAPNFAPGLLEALTTQLGRTVTGSELLAYIGGLVAHSGYTTTFAEQLTTPGIRVPITTDPELFEAIVQVGEMVIWLHTYGEAYTHEDRPHGNVRYPKGDARQPLATSPITSMPDGASYDEEREVLVLGDGEFGPVPPEVWEYTVGGRRVVKSWVDYRKAERGGKKSSPLDYLHTETWDPDWTTELIDLLTILRKLVELEPEQSELLSEVLSTPILDSEKLANLGVRWPKVKKDREPTFTFTTQTDVGQQEFF